MILTTKPVCNLGFFLFNFVKNFCCKYIFTVIIIMDDGYISATTIIRVKNTTSSTCAVFQRVIIMCVFLYLDFSGQQAHKARRQRRCFCCLPLMMSSTSPRITSHALSAMTSRAKPSPRSIFSTAVMNQSKLKAFIQHIKQTVNPGPNS